MKKQIILSLALLWLTGCDYNERYFDGLDEQARPTDVLSLERTLVASDYEAIAANPTNKALAGEAKQAALAALAEEHCFNDRITPQEYLPAYLAALWPGADNTSSVAVTYRIVSPSDAARAVADARTYTLAPADYAAQGCRAPFFTPEHPATGALPDVLSAALPDAGAGDAVFACFHSAATEPEADCPLDCNFEDLWHQPVTGHAPAGWTNLTSEGTNSWGLRAFRGNNYMQASAGGNNGTMRAWLVTPAVTVTAGMELSFDACYGNYDENGGRLHLLLSGELPEADDRITPELLESTAWTDLTDAVSIPVPDGTYGTLGNVCSYPMDAYAGRTLRIAFLYTGDDSASKRRQAATIVQLDNISLRTAGTARTAYTADARPYRYDGSAWKPLTGTIAVTNEQMTVMGSTTPYFTAAMDPLHYLPLLLRTTRPYAAPEETVTLQYKYYGQTGSFRAADFIFRNSEWVYAGIAEQTGRYVRNNGSWMYNPNVSIVLAPVKGDALSVSYYQAICDWVGRNRGSEYYQKGYTNTEYYYGASAYQCHMDLSLDAWRTKSNADYSGYDDSALEALQLERLEEAFLPALEALHPDAEPIEGLDVLYSIDFGLYTGTALTAPNYRITYKVTEKGTFAFVSLDGIE